MIARSALSHPVERQGQAEALRLGQPREGFSSTSCKCPQCGSEDVRLLSLIFKDGFQHVNTRTNSLGLGIGRGGVGTLFGRSNTKGIAQSALSREAAPPLKRKFWVALAAIYFGAWLASHHFSVQSTLTALVIAGAGLAAVIQAWRYNTGEWPGLFDRWSKTFACNRCSHRFIPHAEASAEGGSDDQ